MYLDERISGRSEKRLPIIVVIRLVRLGEAGGHIYERTYTDNISLHGARVHTAHRWQPGEQAEITPLHENRPARGEVVYCQKVGADDFFIGLKVGETGIPWSVLGRYDGVPDPEE